MNTLTVGVCQVRVGADKEKNIANAAWAIAQAHARGASLIVLPEMFTCPYDRGYFKTFAEPVPRGPACEMLADLARTFKAFIVGGSIPERHGKRIYNSSPVFNPGGKLIAVHRKIHLFDVNLKTVRMRESAVFSPGALPTVFTTPFGVFGLAICYDARFPELFRAMLRKKIRGVIVPAAFSIETGVAHWEPLMRMRAVDNQVYVIAASPARTSVLYHAYGHSMAVDPWGKIIAECGTGEEVFVCTLDSQRVADVRERLPLLKHRRPAAY
ncbi:MAG: hypothetical protein A2268_12970 [Candidatus Raymondbacteria bacterium RifOxyA12_full_50_37]|uniref:CN hydrolase domain-containing protein n=1 Tax=Candidatus Raymondbacteria bacterium RIFOXYD12_FULL_49_13 TaxID=1817890 RepID=A0A1F7EZV6_UNCRA|nr:MAG: hypothetical protein A2268_12970 [Candidatus Raymondbacteria bacterium RifOxyA12_full_50_37]OGJ92977.1 MAG: hypothetical protein A2248_18105 [Candidatus Raymondbacteria bacterium RIFOXYA2_FULL_49_16]OGJ97659.1 MAG: hypothetical protein A2487_13095 [Candidatus Raymondbacteria bacterium RifOxyC12_full_50_8]OGJ99891.1 MAG: hypothetical protein A2519_00085 [Candidatus Raymondbacteria bacterium RIFOXYD12_FULL_49_13]OGP40773.1 MAG: hypothetical protein A2324_03675 [Candidatus Raymondbacteria 